MSRIILEVPDESMQALQLSPQAFAQEFWRYDREEDEIPDIFGEVGDASIFVITAY